MKALAFAGPVAATLAAATLSAGCGSTTHSWTQPAAPSRAVAPAATATSSVPAPEGSQTSHGGREGTPASERKDQSEEWKQLEEEHRTRLKQEREKEREEQIKEEDEDQSER